MRESKWDIVPLHIANFNASLAKFGSILTNSAERSFWFLVLLSSQYQKSCSFALRIGEGDRKFCMSSGADIPVFAGSCAHESQSATELLRQRTTGFPHCTCQPSAVARAEWESSQKSAHQAGGTRFLMAGLGRHWQPKLFPPKAIFALMLDDWLTLPPTSPTGSEQKAEEKWLLSIHSTYRLGKKKNPRYLLT